MPHCARCGAELAPGVRFCGQCGTAVSAATGDADAPTATATATETPQPPVKAAGTSSGSVSEGMAIAALLLNALAPLVFLPVGIGSLVAGRKEGWYQLALSLLGSVVAVTMAVSVIFGGFLFFGNERAFFGSLLAAGFLILLAAIAGFAAWIWGIVTGVQLIQEANRARNAAYT